MRTNEGATAQPKWLTIGQAAKRIGVHANTIRRWEKEGLITPVRTPGGARRFRPDEVDRLLTFGCENPTDTPGVTS